MIEELRNKIKELLASKCVDVVLGYQRAGDGVSAKPLFIYTQEDAERLVWDSYCVYNLACYLKELAGKRVGILAKACDVKSITVLLQENQWKRQDLFIIGLEEDKPSAPVTCDYIVKDNEKKQKAAEPADKYESVRKLETRSSPERLKFWEEEFSRCIRCYACRQVCPMCYCPRCVADQSMPAWFSKANSLKGNLSWNVTRAIHLAGRCIDCGECERACPVGIPLMDLNKKIEKDVRELFNYEAGSSVEQKPLLSCFDKNDPADFIK